MAYTTTSGSTDSVYPSVAAIISSDRLTSIYAALGSTNSTVVTTNGAQQIPVSGANTAVIVNESATNQSLLNAAPTDANGAYQIDGSAATFITNTSGSPTYLLGTGGASWIRYEGGGPATIDGSGVTGRFLGDATGVTNPVTMIAGDSDTSDSWLLGGSGPTLMEGALHNELASVIMTAGPGSTTMIAGVGEATMFGGGATTVFGGSHAGQVFSDTTNDSLDSIVAGTGGADTISLWSGNNTVDDTASPGGDFVNVGTDGSPAGYSATGTTTIDGSAGGTSIGLFGGSSVAIDDTTHSATAIFASDGGVDSVSFVDQNNAGFEAQRLADIGLGQTSMTISFTAGDGQGSTATLNNISHIVFK